MMQKQVYHARRYLFLLAIPCVLILILALSACGTNVGAGGPPSSAASTSTPSQTPASPTNTSTGASPTATTNAVQAQNTNDGCPNSAVITTPPPAAAVILKEAKNRATVTAQQGQTIEVDLPSTMKWQGPLFLAQNLLTMQSPSGYAFPATRSCVWRFVATASGVANLSFTGRPICQKAHACPMYIVAIQFTVEIK